MAEDSEFDRVSMILLRSMRAPLLLLVLVYAIGIAGFGLIPGRNGEPMSLFHALYFLSYTATTTGFGELPHAFSNAQRIWAIVLLHLSVIAWLYSIGAIINLVRNPYFRQALARSVFARRVAALGEPFAIICGFGDAGSLLARSLDEQGLAVVVIDNDPDRIKALSLRNFDIRTLGVCADSADPRVLVDAGIQHRLCRGIVAITDDEFVNMKTTIMTRQLNPEISPVCRVDTQACAHELETLKEVRVLDSFEVFAERLRIALNRPALYALGSWLGHQPGATLRQRLFCPAGKWIVLGYGRMGQRLEENLKEQGIEPVIIDPGISESDSADHHIRGSANRETLEQAGIDKASCVIIATDSDATNLRIMMVARELNPTVFTVMRQNRYRNEVVFADAPVDIVMHPDRVIARRTKLELISPRLIPMLDWLENSETDVLDGLIERLDVALGGDTPLLWQISLDERQAPALRGRRSQGQGIQPTLKDLMRDLRDRDVLLGCVPLILERDGKENRLPELSDTLQEGDRILFCGTGAARAAIDAALRNPYTLEYLVSGSEPPRSYLVRYLEKRFQQTQD